MRTAYTNLGKAMFGLAALLYAYAFLFSDLLVALAGSAVLFYMAFRRLQFNRALSVMALDVKREVLENAHYRDSPVPVRIEVSSRLPMDVEVTDRLPARFEHREGEMGSKGRIGGGKDVSFLYTMVPRDRGNHRLEPLELVLTEPKGLFKCTMISDTRTELFVQASKRELAEARILGRKKNFDITGKTRTRRTRTQRTDLRSIRDYMPGDRFRDIDWKAASRLTKLMTREFEIESNVPTMILIDTSMTMRELAGKHTKLDHSLAIAVQMATVLDAQGNPVGIMTYDEHRVKEHLSPGHADLDDILLALFRMPDPQDTGDYPGYVWDRVGEPSEGERAFMKGVGPFLVRGKRPVYDPRRTTGIFESVRAIGLHEESGMLLIIITDLETNRGSLVSSLSMALGQNHRVVLVSAFSWPYHVSRSGLDVGTLERMYLDSQEKQRILANLRSAGVRVIDIAPGERGDRIMGRLRRMAK